MAGPSPPDWFTKLWSLPGLTLEEKAAANAFVLGKPDSDRPLYLPGSPEEAVASIKSIISIGAATGLRPDRATAVNRAYTIVHHRQKLKTSLPSRASLQAIADATENHWGFLAAAAYSLKVDDRDMDEASWDAYLSHLQPTAPVTLRAFSKGRPFSQYTGVSGLELQRLASRNLGVNLGDCGTPVTKDELFPELEIPDGVMFGGRSFTDLLDTVASGLQVTALGMSHAVGAVEMLQRDFITPVLAAAVVVARSLGPTNDDARIPAGDLHMLPEYHIVGKMAWGPVDYAILYQTVAVVVAEAKRYAPCQAWAQAYMQISATRDSLMRRLLGTKSKKRNHWQANELCKIPTYAVLCTSTCYHLLVYMPAGFGGQKEEPSRLLASHQMLMALGRSVSLEYTKGFLKPLMLKLAKILVNQMEVISEAVVAIPGLAKMDPVSGPKVVEQEEQANMDHMNQQADEEEDEEEDEEADEKEE